jgi:RNA polymerase sigma factor (sigma-70 family)
MVAPISHDHTDLRPLMFPIAYRMTGSVVEAEDLVQEAFFRLERARQSRVAVDSPKAYLAATTTRLAIDHMRSARTHRESYEQMAELSDSLSMAFLVLLESLSSVERAVFLLREVFDYSYEDIGRIIDKARPTAARSSSGPASISMPITSVTKHRATTVRLCSDPSSPRRGAAI